MKNGLIILSIAFCVLFSSCKREQDNVYGDMTAYQHLQATQKQAYDALVAAPNGWAMLYFANQESAGYPILMKFEKDGTVLMAANNSVTSGSAYKEEKSLWQVDASQGPVLTFDSYNNLFHTFADPGDDGDGMLGDYEFAILSATADEICLKGKKHEAYIVMQKLPQDMDWKDYYTQANEISKVYLGSNNFFAIQYGDQIAYLTQASNGIFNRYNEKFVRDSLYSSVTYVITPSGFHIQGGWNMGFLHKENNTWTKRGDQGARDFLKDELTGTFVAEKAVLKAPELGVFAYGLIEMRKNVQVNNSDSRLSPAIAQLKKDLDNQLAGVFGSGSKYQSIIFGYAGYKGDERMDYKIVMQFTYRDAGHAANVPAQFLCQLVPQGNQIAVKLVRDAEGKIIADAEGQALLAKYDKVGAFIQAFEGTMQVTTTNASNPAKAGLTLTSTDNPANWYTLTAGGVVR